jgi:AcrR family transcriptional regulator
MKATTGLRERQKRQTRELILDASAGLFADRGFDGVTVAEVAREADVSEMTVFNHFPTKEHLFFARMEFFEEQLIEAVRNREAGTSALEAFGGLVIASCSRLAESGRAEAIARTAEQMKASRALQAREREIVERYTGQLADLLATDDGAPADDVAAWAAAAALMGAHRALVRYVRAQVVAGRRGVRLAAAARSQARRAFTRLGAGLAAYAPKPDAHSLSPVGASTDAPADPHRRRVERLQSPRRRHSNEPSSW